MKITRFLSPFSIALVIAGVCLAHDETAAVTQSYSSEINWETVVPEAHSGRKVHGLPILETDLTPQERKYWENYNTTTYFTLDSPYQTQLWAHFALLVVSFALFYPFVMVFANLDSNWYLPGLTVQAGTSILSCVAYSIFIHNVPDLYPNMAYTKMVTGLFVLTIIQYSSALIYLAKQYLEGGSHRVTPRSFDTFMEDSIMPPYAKDIPLQSNLDDEIHSHSPSSTLYDRDSFDLATPEAEPLDGTGPIKHKSKLANTRDNVLATTFQYPLVEKLVKSFGFMATLIYRILNFGIFFYFLVLLPTGIACLSLFGQGSRVFNLLAHFIKGGVFFILGVFMLARYLGAFQHMGGAWNYSYITEDDKRHSLWFRIQPKNSLITFEMIESSLILFYGCTNIFLEHLADAGKGWSAKDLQHASIAFMYIGAGLCGVITEIQLGSWRRTKFFDQVDNAVDTRSVSQVTPGFSPNPFPVFTIFWTGLLMSQHEQSSELATKIHVQWGNLLSYGSVFRLFTFLMLTYYPLKDRAACFSPARPFTELIVSFCMMCGGLIFMESADESVNAIAYRGYTPMLTINLSVGVISLIMAWIMLVFAFKGWLKRKMYDND